MKIFLNKIKEDWIIDRVSHEFSASAKNLVTRRVVNSDIIWIIAPWTWKKIPIKYLKSKKVVCSYYHFDFSNFNEDEFYLLDQYVDEYHVISKKTKLDLEKLTNKKITNIPFWVDHEIFFEIKDKINLRTKYGFSNSDFLVGSFQRDTEGKDLLSPKLVKGPDRFLEIVQDMYEKDNNVKIILSGKRRQYLINNFKKYSIPYKHYEMVDFTVLNELYNLLNLYIVSSRIEGGPQAIVECGLSKTPIISTDVGVAREILSESSIFSGVDYLSAKPNIEHAYKNSINLSKENNIKNFFKMFEMIYEN